MQRVALSRGAHCARRQVTVLGGASGHHPTSRCNVEHGTGVPATIYRPRHSAAKVRSKAPDFCSRRRGSRFYNRLAQPSARGAPRRSVELPVAFARLGLQHSCAHCIRSTALKRVISN
ncbi:hypothetical protein HaLaN_02314, partial [Haematococcus lacustris]